ncbi:hypothetical protein Hanom_Chr16g01442681 [Helianthus anomalus]
MQKILSHWFPRTCTFFLSLHSLTLSLSYIHTRMYNVSISMQIFGLVLTV